MDDGGLCIKFWSDMGYIIGGSRKVFFKYRRVDWNVGSKNVNFKDFRLRYRVEMGQSLHLYVHH